MRILVTDGDETTLIEGVSDKKIKIHQLKISSDTLANFTLRSGDEIIFTYYYKLGYVDANGSTKRLYESNEGKGFTIQSSVPSLNANVDVEFSIC